ncbi:ferric iron reductase [Sinorhizobium numidicum]|uniref:Ferric iron reductase n=1 Tax=Sinorhizobium numidicum TaxID=680248 RepID=A0ABY8CWV0_9HYPH|nr:ferric iron reductase [Sinorhizobium numidicum]WEX76454.1 ferric iron reductase [Sinorhizobium numidicum]WEX83115.1 ferric iron reductase [Sinorhizobium numidicum]
MQQRQGRASSAASGEDAAAAIEWLAAAFPEVACSSDASAAKFIPATAFWRDASASVEACLAYQNRFASGMDDKVRAAHLIAFYSHQLSLVTVTVFLATGLVPELAGLRFESYLRPVGERTLEASRFHFLVELPQIAAGARPEEAGSRFRDVFVAQLKPVITLLSRRCGLSVRAQWRLAADSLAGAFLEIGRRQGKEAEAIAHALAIVKHQGSPLFTRELHYEEIDAAVPCNDGERALSQTYRMRGGCCLYYRTDAGSYCDSCVLLRPEIRRERLRAHLRETARE